MTAAPVDTGALAAQAATAVSRLLPSAVPLVPAPLDPGQLPAPSESAVVASYVGILSADLVIVADRAVQDVLSDEAALSLADALRPAMEAACGVLGAGVLGTTEVVPVGTLLTDPGTSAFALAADGAAHAWFAIRFRPGRQSSAGTSAAEDRTSLRVLYDVEMTLTAEIGRTKLPVRHVLDLAPGSVIELDRAAGTPADLMVNGRLIARGEVVVVDEDYGIRIVEIVAGSEGGD